MKVRRMRERLLWMLPASLLALLGVAPPATADDIFLQMNGIPGESADTKHKDSMNVDSFSFGVSRGAATRSKAAGPRFQDVHFTKRADRASPLLFERLVTGQVVSAAKLTVRVPGQSPFEYLRYCFDDVTINSFESNGSSQSNSRVVDSGSFGFESVRITYLRQAQDGSLAETVFSGWDVVNSELVKSQCK